MLNLVLTAALLATTPAAPAAPAAAPSGPAKPPAVTAKAEEAKAPAKPEAPKKASKEALADAKGALLGPCSPEMATAKVTTVSVIDGKKLNELIEKDKLELPKAYPTALFMVVGYDNRGEAGSDYRQITTHYHLTTEQAQALVGEKLCVFGKLKP